MQVFLIEKTRIAQRPEGEPTFHVFYHLLAGIEADLRYFDIYIFMVLK